ncbi:MBL fold metallo-hydrolase [Catellatospora citrea]|uniref:ComEC/Rec2 family competence protein n=1 Tax=Catellatospora citrea TaxID=53366 RepID=UPI0033F47617
MTNASVTVVDVGHGSCCVIKSDQDVSIVDTGSGSSLAEFLRLAGIKHIDRVLISHADVDHCGGLLLILSSREFTVQRVYLNSDAAKASRRWEDLRSALEEYERQGGQVVLGFLRQSVTIAAGIFTFEVLAPRLSLAASGPGGRDQDGHLLEANTLSAVVRVLLGDKPVILLTGDVDDLGYKHMTLSGATTSLAAPVLVFPHHGGHANRLGDSAINFDFAKAMTSTVQPELVLFSTGRGRHGTPRHEIVAGIRAASPDARIACTQLSENCSMGALQSRNPTIAHTVFARGSASGHCCAGSIVLALGDVKAIAFSDGSDHSDFVSLNVPGALCRQSSPQVPGQRAASQAAQGKSA